jgi:signal transduction histidine kinase
LDYSPNQDAYDDMRRTIALGRPWMGLLRSVNLEGRLADEEVSVTPIRNSEGEVYSYVVVKRDVTEKRALEAQLAQAQKLESVGRLAAGIAHEINTPSQYVGGNIRFLQDSFGELDALLDKLSAQAAHDPALRHALQGADLGFLREEIPRALAQSADGISRISSIVRAMKEFSHPAQEKTAIDLNRAITSTLTVATNEWKYVAELHTDLDPSLPPIPCLPGEFNQVILNMVVNAAHAIAAKRSADTDPKGTLTISTRLNGAFAEIRISDTGTGIPAEIRQKIFDPFFTTKPLGQGTGQGLAIAYDVIVNKHHGSIALESEPGQGSTFIISLPTGEDSITGTSEIAAA